MPGPLDGFRILEVAQVYAVPAAGTLLADMGADVVKVEPPWGDSTRYGRPFLPGEGRNFVGLNHGKRSICLNLDSADARPVIERLVAGADVVLVSLQRSQAERYGLTYADCAAIRPEIVYAMNTALGPDGPLAGLGGYDMTVAALAGIGAAQGHMSEGQLVSGTGVAITDAATSFLLVAAVSAALLHRTRTGVGQCIETSNLATGLNCQLQFMTEFDADSDLMDRFQSEVKALRRSGAPFDQVQDARRRLLGRASGASVYYRIYRTKDSYISIGALSPHLAERFRAATGLEDPRQREGFDAGNPEDAEMLSNLPKQAEAIFTARTADEWVEVFTTHRVPHARVNLPEEAMHDEQVVANGYVTDLEHGLLGPYRTVSPPVKMSVSHVSISRPAPQLDEHTDEILTAAGFSAAEVASLRAAGVAGRQEHLPADYH